MSVKKLGKLTSPKTTGPIGIVGEPDMRWQAEDAMRTIHRAEEHKKNRPLMKEVKKLVRAHAKACGMK